MLHSLSRTLHEEVQFDTEKVTSVDWSSHPTLTHADTPESIDVVLVNGDPNPDRSDLPPYGGGEAACKPMLAAVANAIYDATGVRLRRIPFRAPRVLAALKAAQVSREGIQSASLLPTEPRQLWSGIFGGQVPGILPLLFSRNHFSAMSTLRLRCLRFSAFRRSDPAADGWRVQTDHIRTWGQLRRDHCGLDDLTTPAYRQCPELSGNSPPASDLLPSGQPACIVATGRPGRRPDSN